MDRLPKGIYGCIEPTIEWKYSSNNKKADLHNVQRKQIERMSDEIRVLKHLIKQLKRVV
jgi:hypothetical protein